MKNAGPVAARLETERFLSAQDLMRRYGVTRVSLWNWERTGVLPAGIFIGPNTKRWSASAIAEFERRRATGM